MLDSISVLSSSFDAKLAEFKEQLMEEQKMENNHLTKKLKLEKKLEFRRKGSEIQHAFNEGVKAVVDETAAILDKHPASDLEKAKEQLENTEMRERKREWKREREREGTPKTEVNNFAHHSAIVLLSSQAQLESGYTRLSRSSCLAGQIDA